MAFTATEVPEEGLEVLGKDGKPMDQDAAHARLVEVSRINCVCDPDVSLLKHIIRSTDRVLR